MKGILRCADFARAYSILLLLGAASASATEHPRVEKGIVYARVGDERLCFDLYLPANQDHPKTIVWVHGGAWRSGSRSDMPLGWLVDDSFAVISVDYRLSTIARYPAQVFDVKAAIRYLRAHQNELRIDARRLAIAGSSAGGHIAALVGVTGRDTELEGDVGNDLDQSSSVQAIVDWFGPTDLTTILDQSTPHGLNVRVPALKLLLGGLPAEKPHLTRLASPVFAVDPADPPLLVVHGDQDPQVPINQSHELVGRYKRAQLPVEFEVVYGGGHDGESFFDADRSAIVSEFLNRHL